MTSETYQKPDKVEYLVLFALLLLPNIVLINFFSGFVHDDAFQLQTTNDYDNKNWFGNIYYFNAFRENLLSHLAAFGSPLLSRFFIVTVYICGGALLLYRLLASYLSVPKPVAFVGASLPFLTASIWSIPNGMNIAYVTGDVFFTIIAFIIVGHLLTRKFSWLAAVPLIGILFILATEVQPTASVTTPLIFLSAVLIPSQRYVLKLILLAVLSYAVFHVLFGETGGTRKAIVGFGTAVDNYFQYQLNGLKITNPNLPGWLWIIVNLLAIFGIVLGAISALPPRKDSKNSGSYAWATVNTPAIAVGLLALAIIVWTPTPYAVVSSNPAAAQQVRYYFIWLFGYWSLWATGLLFLTANVSQRIASMKKTEGKEGKTFSGSFNQPVVFVLSGLIAASFSAHKGMSIPQELKDSSNLVRVLKIDMRQAVKLDSNRQMLLILDHPSVKWVNQKSLSHVSNPRAGLGLINYILQPQNYAHGVIALPSNCSGIFDKWTANYSYYEVSGFDFDYPITVAKYKASARQVTTYDYLLDFTSPEDGRVLDVSSSPVNLGNFSSPDTLKALLSTAAIEPQDVAFASVYLAGTCKFSDRGWSPTTPSSD